MGKHTEELQGYNVTITGRHVMVTDGMKQHAMNKIAKIDRLGPRNVDMHVIMDIQKLEHRIDVIVRFNQLKIKVHGVSTDMYASIDEAMAKLEFQLRRFKDKIQKHQLKTIPVSDMQVAVIPREVDEINDAIDQANRETQIKETDFPRVVRYETLSLKTLTQDEAAMKIELSGDPFLIYRSEDDQKVKVIYRRPDDNFGIINPY